MSKIQSERLYRERARLLNRARELARSGQHTDHTSIITHLETLEGFTDARERLATIRGQLNRLCAMVRDTSVIQIDLAALRAGRRARDTSELRR